MPTKDKKTNISKLYTKLIYDNDIKTIKDTISDVGTDTVLSANQTLSILQNQGTTSKLFLGLRTFLALVEGVRKQTYPDNKNNMTFGIGVNLENPDSEALIIALNKKFSLNLNYEQLKTTPGLPLHGLIDDQVNYLLWLTLIGTEQQTDHGLVKFVGLTEQMIHYMNIQVPDLANESFRAYEIIAIQSLAFNNPGKLIGKGLCNALQKYYQTNNFMNVLIQIVEESNLELDVGISNRRLKEAGLFSGQPQAIHLPYRQARRIQNKNPDLVFIGGQPIHSLPIGNREETYLGQPEVTIDPGQDPQHLDSIYYGSYQPDEFNNLQGGSKVVFGGGGNDKMSAQNAKQDDNSTSYHYLAGNVGKDVYKLNKKSGHPLIFDADHDGILQLDSDMDEIAGFGIAVDENNFTLQGNNQTYTLTRSPNNSVKKISDSGDNLNVNWGDANNDINIANFVGGQFNIVLINQCISVSNLWTSLAIMLPNNLMASIVVLENGNYLQFLDRNGKLINQIFLTAMQTGSAAIDYFPNNNVVTVWQTYESDNAQNIYGAVANQNGIISSFKIIYPSGYECSSQNCAASYTAVFVAEDGSFTTVYMLRMENTSVLCCQSSIDSISAVIAVVNGGLASTQLGEVTYLGKNIFSAIVYQGPPDKLFICNTAGQILYEFPLERTFTSVSRLSNGFVLSFLEENQIYTRTFIYGGDWSKPMLIGSGVGIARNIALPNDHTLIVYDFNKITPNVALINANNTQIGKAVPLGNFFGANMFGGTTYQSLPDGNTYILLGYADEESYPVFISYFCETSALQPQISQQQPHQETIIMNKNNKPKTPIKIKNDDDQPQQISAANQVKNPWELPLKLSKLAINGLAATWAYFQNSKSQENSQSVNSNSTALSNFKTKKKSSNVKTITAACENLKIEETFALECGNKNYTAYVFPKTPETTDVSRNFIPNSPIKSDRYDTATCRSVEFHREPSVFCEGERTNLIYTPHLSHPPLENLDGNIMLGAVAINNLADLLNKNSSPEKEFLSPLMYQKEMQRFERKLEWLEQEFHIADQPVPIAVEDLRLDLAKLKQQGKATKDEAKAFRDGIKDARKYFRQMSKYLEAKQQILKNVSSRKTSDKNKTDSILNLLTPQRFFAEKHRIDPNHEPRTLPVNSVNIIPRLTK